MATKLPIHHDDLYTPGQCPVSLFLCTPWWFIHTWTMSCFSISMYTMMIYTHLNDVLFLYFYVHHDDSYTPRRCPVLLFLCKHDDSYTPGQCPVSLFLCTPLWFIHTWTMSCFSISMFTMMIYTHLNNVLFLYFYVHHDDSYTPRRCPVLLFLCKHDDSYTPGQCPVSLFLCTPWWFIHTWTISCFSISMYTLMIYTHLDNVLFLYFYVHHDDLYTPRRLVSLFLCTPW